MWIGLYKKNISIQNRINARSLGRVQRLVQINGRGGIVNADKIQQQKVVKLLVKRIKYII